jgi:ferrous iron transport protein B
MKKIGEDNPYAKLLAGSGLKERVHVSFAGRLGRFLEPVSKLAGFDWKVNIALASSFAAKENLVATLGTIYSVGEESLFL